MSWYRTGTVAVTNGSTMVTGVGTLWTTAVNPGDAFALVDANLNPTGAWYEVESVTNNTTMVLKQSYAGTTGSNQKYCVFNLVGNMTTPSFAQRLATFFASFQSLIDKPTTTPTASSIPIADSGGKIADGWIPETVARTASPALTGTPTAPTAPASTDSTQIATTAHVKSVVGDYAPLASPALTGSPTAPTQPASDDSTKIATTAYVKNQVASDTVAGMVELATPAEVLAGVDTERGITPATLTAKILGTVSQSDGVPTGAVIERGSNANGEYVKFADGTAMCSRNINWIGTETYRPTATLPIPITSQTGLCQAIYSASETSFLAINVAYSSPTEVLYWIQQVASTGTVSKRTGAFIFGIYVYGRWY